MVELKGSLSGIGLPAITQLIGDLHHSGSLELHKGTSSGVLFFDDGRLVSARYVDDQEGLDALTRCVLDLGDAAFTFVEGSPPLERTLDLSPRALQRYVKGVESGDVAAEPIQLAAPAVPDPA